MMENVTVTVKADITNLKTAMKEAEKVSKQTQKAIQSGWEQAADRVAKSFSRIADESRKMNEHAAIRD